MDLTPRIEQALESALSAMELPGAPPRLISAMQHAVFPGGARLRPRLCLAVAHACGDGDGPVADGAAAAIELLHCASLVHDDLPCFDDAGLRRGKPAVHVAFGEPLAVLTGDALIVLAFETLARGCAMSPHLLGPLIGLTGRSVGVPFGIAAGQAWESEPNPDLEHYQRAKTGALFVGAATAGAVAAGVAAGSAALTGWRQFGEALGEAYQVADDVRDVAADGEEFGKTAGRDAAKSRPSAARALGIAGAVSRLEALIAQALDAIPECRGRHGLQAIVRDETRRFLPLKIRERVAA